MKSRVLHPNPGNDEATAPRGPSNKLAVPLPIPAFRNKPRSDLGPAPEPVAEPLVGAQEPHAAAGQGSALPDVSGVSTRPGAGEIIEIPVDLIDPNPFAPREIYTSEMILLRADNLRTQKQHDPIHVIPNPDAPGRYIIADGWTRTLACKTHGVFPTLKAIVHTGLTAEEAAWFGFESNEGREQHCDFDRAMFFEKLIAEGQSPTDVAERAKLSRSQMSMYRAFGKLPSEIIELIKARPAKFGHRVAYELSRIYEFSGVRKAVAIAAKYSDEDHPHRWLINQVQAILHPSGRKQGQALKHIRYSNGYYKQSSDEFELAIKVSPEKRESFAAALEALLNTVVDSPSGSEDHDDRVQSPPGEQS